LSGEDQKQFSKRYTESAEAYQLYLKGRYEWNKRRPNRSAGQELSESLKKSTEYFNQAIERDPGYALAYAGLADVYNVAATYLEPKEVFPRAKAAAMKAVELDDTLAEAHSALATVKSHDWDWSGAEREFRRALELNPGYATAHYFYGFSHLCPLGRLEEAVSEMKKAIELDPLSGIVNTNFGLTLYLARRYDEALAQFRKVNEIDPKVGYHGPLSAVFEQKGMYEEAIGELEKFLPYERGYLEPKEIAEVRQAYAVSGVRGYWQKRLELLKNQAKERYVPPFFFALLYARLGDTDQAFQWLEKGYEARDGFVHYLKVQPVFDNLRSDPRYADLVRRIGLPP
jgi:Tfp pilus assembly protein PilF